MRSILLLLAIPAMASAQTTNTNCWVNGQNVNCTTQGPVGGVDTRPTDYLGPMGGVQNLPGAVAPIYQQGQPTQDGPPPQLRAAWAHTADLIKAHRCDEAVDFALRQGGTEAAARVKSICQ